MRTNLAVLALGALLAGCGEFLDLSAEAPNACIQVTGLHVYGLNELPTTNKFTPSGAATVRQVFDVPLDSSVLPTGSNTRVGFVSCELAAKGTGNFGSVASAQIAAVTTSGGTRPLASYSRTETAPAAIAMRPDPAPEVTAYITNGVLRLEGALTGTTPTKGFDVTATVCLSIATNFSAQ